MAVAKFALLDDNKIVTKVVVIDGAEVPSDMHPDGEEYCRLLFNVEPWKQSADDGRFRKQPASPGYTYDAAKDIFIKPKPHTSWTLNLENDWESPVTYPTIISYVSPTLTYEAYEDGDDIPAGKNVGDSKMDPLPEGKSVGDNRTVQYRIGWNEDNQQWVAHDIETPINNYVWNTSTLVWDKI